MSDEILSVEDVAMICAAVATDRGMHPLFLRGMRKFCDSHEALRAARAAAEERVEEMRLAEAAERALRIQHQADLRAAEERAERAEREQKRWEAVAEKAWADFRTHSEELVPTRMENVRLRARVAALTEALVDGEVFARTVHFKQMTPNAARLRAAFIDKAQAALASIPEDEEYRTRGRTDAGSEPPSVAGKQRAQSEGRGLTASGAPVPNDSLRSTGDAAATPGALPATPETEEG